MAHVIVPLGGVYTFQIKENSDVVAIEDGVPVVEEGGGGILKASLSLSLSPLLPLPGLSVDSEPRQSRRVQFL